MTLRNHQRKTPLELNLLGSWARPGEIFLAGIVHPPINEWKLWHWSRWRRECKKWDTIVAVVTAKGRMPKWPVDTPAAIRVRYGFPRRSQYDPDNFAPKMLLDALVSCSILPDDSCNVVASLTISCHPGQDYHWTHLQMRPYLSHIDLEPAPHRSLASLDGEFLP